MHCLFSLALVCAAHAAHPIPKFEHFPPHRQAVLDRALGDAYRAGSRDPPVGVASFDPADYGGDNTGVTDSADAVEAAIAAMVSISNRTAGGITDLGGAMLNFNGGVFSVSRTIAFPDGYGNFFIQGGTLRARLNFAGTELLRVGSLQAVKGKAAQSVRIESMTFDGQNKVNTTVAVFNGQYVDIGPAVMVYGFEVAGIKLDGTGGGYIHHSWLGQYAPDKQRLTPTATAVVLETPQHDGYVDTVIIWSAKVGILAHTGANQISGVHTWNLSGRAGGACMIFKGYMGAKGKVIDSYLDFCPIVVEDPSSMIITNNLFLATANVVLRSGSKHEIAGLIVSNNRFDSEGGKWGNTTFVVDGHFTKVSNAVIESNIADKWYPHRGTRATITADAEGTSTTIDFTDALLFSLQIQEVACSLQSSTPVSHSFTFTSQTVVEVHYSAALPKGSRVTCTAEQSQRVHPAH